MWINTATQVRQENFLAVSEKIPYCLDMSWRLHLADELTLDEGVRFTPYKDTQGFWTVGVGRNLSARGMSAEEVSQLAQLNPIPADLLIQWLSEHPLPTQVSQLMLQNDITQVNSDANQYSWFGRLTEDQQNAIRNLIFNLGATTFKKFRRLHESLRLGQYTQAGRELLYNDFGTPQQRKTLYYKQVGERARRLAERIAMGKL